MSKQANFTVIGAFIVAGVAAAMAALVIFGSGKFLTESVDYVTCFSGSVKGLRLGAAVNFRGARVGTVKEIRLVYAGDRQDFFIPVVIEIVKGSVIITGEGDRNRYITDREHRDTVARLIDQNDLRAQLSMESFVTGQLFVELDFHPDTKPRYAKLDLPYHEIPTIPSGFEKISAAVQNIKFDKIANDLEGALAAFTELSGSEDLRESIKSMRTFLDSGNEVLAEIKERIPEIDAQGKELAAQTRNLLDQAEKTFKTYQDFAAPGSPLEREVLQTLRDVRSAATSLRSFAEFIERNPESLLRGKGKE